MKRPPVLLLAIGAVAGLIFACKSGDDNGSPNIDIADPCKLLTESEVELVAGPVSEGALTVNGSTSTCAWDGPDSTAKFTIVAQKQKNSEDAAKAFDSVNGEAINGYGDKAEWVAEGAGYFEVLKANYDLTFTYARTADMDDIEHQNSTLALAGAAIDGLH